MELTNIESGFTSIAVLPDAVTFSQDALNGRSRPRATGARVVLEFVRSEPLAPGAPVRIRYDIAENGRVREFTSVPQLTHTKRLPGFATYHYRAAHWIPADRLSEQPLAPLSSVPPPVLVFPMAAAIPAA